MKAASVAGKGKIQIEVGKWRTLPLHQSRARAWFFRRLFTAPSVEVRWSVSTVLTGIRQPNSNLPGQEEQYLGMSMLPGLKHWEKELLACQSATAL